MPDIAESKRAAFYINFHLLATFDADEVTAQYHNSSALIPRKVGVPGTATYGRGIGEGKSRIAP